MSDKNSHLKLYRYVPQRGGIKGLCGPGHRLAHDGCAICGPAVRLAPGQAAPYVRKGRLREVSDAKPAQATTAANDDRPSVHDLEALAARIEVLNKLLAERDADIEFRDGMIGDLRADLTEAKREVARLRTALEPPPAPSVDEVDLSGLGDDELLGLANRLRVSRGDQVAEFGDKRSLDRARKYLGGLPAADVRAALEA